MSYRKARTWLNKISIWLTYSTYHNPAPPPKKKTTPITHTAIISINYATPILDPSYYHNSSKGKLHSSPPQDIRLLPVWNRWTEIRAFSRAVWFTQLIWTLSKWNSAYWGRKYSRFGHWVYFAIWGLISFTAGRVRRLGCKAVFWYIGDRRTRCLSISQNFISPTSKIYSPNWDINTKCIARCLSHSIGVQRKLWISKF